MNGRSGFEEEAEPADETVLALELAVSIATRLERRIGSALVYLASLEQTEANRTLAAFLRGEGDPR